MKGIPLLAKNHVETQTDTEVKLPKPIAVKAGEKSRDYYNIFSQI